ncbi:MAG TPA: hypothetical protein VIK92_09650 [Thermaerobacter sp.]
MEPHERQYVELLVAMAVDRFSERIIQRSGGVAAALKQLRADPHGEGIWLGRFVDAFFRDALLDNPGGACLVLRALADRRWEAGADLPAGATVGEVLQHMAKRVFETLLVKKTEEALERELAFGGE